MNALSSPELLGRLAEKLRLVGRPKSPDRDHRETTHRQRLNARRNAGLDLNTLREAGLPETHPAVALARQRLAELSA